MSRRDQIRMTDEEVRDFVRGSKTIILCSSGPDGVPHPMPMWFVADDDLCIRMTTYGKSQKVLNLERDPRASLLVEAGEAYEELQGVLMYGKVELVRDTEQVIDTLLDASNTRPGDDPEQTKAVRESMRANASKRVLMRFRPDRVVSWNHAKLAGIY